MVHRACVRRYSSPAPTPKGSRGTKGTRLMQMKQLGNGDPWAQLNTNTGLLWASQVAQWSRIPRRGFDPWMGKIPYRGKWQPSHTLGWENPMDRGAWQTTVHGVARVERGLAAEQLICYLTKEKQEKKNQGIRIPGLVMENFTNASVT